MTKARAEYPKVKIESLASPEPGSFKIGPFGSSLKKDELVADGIPVVGIENVLSDFSAKFHKFVTNEKFGQLSQYEIRPGDLLVTTMGTIGRAAVVPEGLGPAIIDSHLFRMRVDQTKIFPPYLCYAVNGYTELRQELVRMAGGAIMAGLNTKILKACSLPLPFIDEQKRVAAILTEAMSTVERARVATETQLEAARALPAAYLRAVFNSPEAQQWPRKRLDEVCDFLDSRRIPVNDTQRAKRIQGKQQSQLYPYYGANGQVGWIDDYIFDEPLILLAEDGGFFGSTYRPIAYAVSGKYWVNNHAHVLRPKALIDFDYCLWCIRIRPDVGDMVSGSTRAKMNQKVAARISIPLPPLSEQKNIARRLSEQVAAADKARKVLEDKLEAINALPAALLRRAFAGEL